VPFLLGCNAQRKAREQSVPGFSSWFQTNKGPIGPPVAHRAAAVGLLLTLALTYVLGSMGHISKTWSVVLILAGYAIPFAIARELVAKRMHKLSDEER
jgi:hypothetical protein